MRVYSVHTYTRITHLYAHIRASARSTKIEKYHFMGEIVKPPMRVMMCGKQKVDIKSFIQLYDMKLTVSSPLVGAGK